MVETVFDIEGLLAVKLALFGLTFGNGGSLSLEAGLLLLLGLRAILVHETEELGGGVLVESVAELGNRRGDLETLVEDDLLSLQLDIFGPLDEAGQVTGRLNVLACVFLSHKLSYTRLAKRLTNAERARALLNERALRRFRVLGGLWLGKGRSGGFLSSLLGLKGKLQSAQEFL